MAKESEEISIQSATDGTTIWLVDSKTKTGTAYGNYTALAESYNGGLFVVSTTRTVTNTISGTYTSKRDIEAALNCTIGVSDSKSITYNSVSYPDDGKTRVLYCRPVYDKYTVVQQKYTRLDGKNYPTGEKKTCYVNKFSHWGFKVTTY